MKNRNQRKTYFVRITLSPKTKLDRICVNSVTISGGIELFEESILFPQNEGFKFWAKAFSEKLRDPDVTIRANNSDTVRLIRTANYTIRRPAQDASMWDGKTRLVCLRALSTFKASRVIYMLLDRGFRGNFAVHSQSQPTGKCYIYYLRTECVRRIFWTIQTLSADVKFGPVRFTMDELLHLLQRLTDQVLTVAQNYPPNINEYADEIDECREVYN